jgi:hypothetical protein
MELGGYVMENAGKGREETRVFMESHIWLRRRLGLMIHIMMRKHP